MYQYKHGGNVHVEPDKSHFLDFSANINPLGMSQHVIDAVKDAVSFCHRYPDHRAMVLRESISCHERIAAANIFCGHGASDIIFRLPLCIKPRKVLVLWPTFSDYVRSVTAFGAQTTFYRLKEECGFLGDRSIVTAAEREHVEMIFLCQPNNPTGVLFERCVIEELLECCQKRGIFVVVDECFIDFVEHANDFSVKPLLEKYDCLIIIKAFTKIFAMPGLRLGYALCNNAVMVDALYACGTDWTVSYLAQVAGIAALQNAESYINETVALVTRERNHLKTELERLNYQVFDGRANFLFFKCPYDFDLQEALDAYSIRIRAYDQQDVPGTGYYRIAVMGHEDNCRLIKALRMIVLKNKGDEWPKH